MKYSWDLQLNKKVPVDLALHFGAGQARLDLASLQLRGVEVNMGVGQLDLDLREQPKHSYNVAIHGGIGEATVRVPRMPGIYAEAHGGIGEHQGPRPAAGERTLGQPSDDQPKTRSASKSRAASADQSDRRLR